MDINEWLPKLSPATQDWIAGNHGRPIPDHIRDEIVAAGGPSDFSLDDGIDVSIDELGDGEVPGPEN